MCCWPLRLPRRPRRIWRCFCGSRLQLIACFILHAVALALTPVLLPCAQAADPHARACMVTLLACSPNLVGSGSWGSLHHQLSISPTASGQGTAPPLSGMSQAAAQPQHTPARKATRNEILDAFIGNLRHRGSIDLEATGVLPGIREHFQRLPTRYALDVNISTLDVLNHKRCGLQSI